MKQILQSKRIFGACLLVTFFLALTPALVAAAITASSSCAGGFQSVFGQVCSYGDWIKYVWDWAMVIVVPLSTLMLIWAGILWTTSAGDPDKIGLSKKIIYGVVSGILLLVLARVLIVNVIGLDSSAWNINGSGATTPSSPSGAGGGFAPGGGSGGGGGGGGGG